MLTFNAIGVEIGYSPDGPHAEVGRPIGAEPIELDRMVCPQHVRQVPESLIGFLQRHPVRRRGCFDRRAVVRENRVRPSRNNGVSLSPHVPKLPPSLGCRIRGCSSANNPLLLSRRHRRTPFEPSRSPTMPECRTSPVVGNRLTVGQDYRLAKSHFQIATRFL